PKDPHDQSSSRPLHARNHKAHEFPHQSYLRCASFPRSCWVPVARCCLVQRSAYESSSRLKTLSDQFCASLALYTRRRSKYASSWLMILCLLNPSGSITAVICEPCKKTTSISAVLSTLEIERSSPSSLASLSMVAIISHHRFVETAASAARFSSWAALSQNDTTIRASSRSRSVTGRTSRHIARSASNPRRPSMDFLIRSSVEL